uniref:Cystatin domain-containing protein n=1 Tax=Rhabditophanes sp. KR3021 TaxID=114890 RepID=A0AC35U1T7_9BILA
MPYKKEIEKEWVAESITDQRIVEYAQNATIVINKYDVNDTSAYQSLVEIVSAKVRFDSKLFYRIQIKTGETDVKKNEVRHKDLNYDELKASVNGTETLYNVTIGVEWYKEESFYIKNV